MKKTVILSVLVAFFVVSNGCSIKAIALNSVGDALSGGGTVFTSDNDPDLVKESLPFALKMYESVLDGVPDHKGLILSTAKAFTMYGYAFLQMEADNIDKKDYEKAKYLRERAQKLYIRGRDYALKGLELNHPGFNELLKKDVKAALLLTNKEDVSLLYWAGSSWVAALTTDKGNIQLVIDSTVGAALVGRVLELDETYDDGSAHDFYISWEGSRSESMGGSEKRAREHFKKALEINKGKKAGTYLSLAAISQSKQDVNEFRELLKKALEIDVDKNPENRLANIIYQRRAKYMLENIDEFFLIDEPTDSK
ncbi:MAG: TRAP transporter TatT component family protein [Candidatus Firestonebacteria bacterium]|nr:TRAP transporter TatT component family protein [Candidatus Firestonebacteria bacterium]